MSETVTAVITTHNRDAAMVRRALVSVLHQTRPAEQIIIVDDSDAGFPGSRDILEMAEKESGGRAEILRHSACRGLPAARNTGLSHARGKYVAFLDDDDEWLPEKTALQLAAFRKAGRAGGPEPCLVYGGGIVMNDCTGRTERIRCRSEKGNVYRKLLAGNWIGYPSFVMFRRECLEAVGGFDETLSFMEDYDLYLRLARQYPATCSGGALAVYHEHEDGQMTDDLRRYIEGLKAVYRRYGADIAADRVLNRKFWVRTACAFADLPDPAGAMRAFRKAFPGAQRYSISGLLVRRRIEKICRQGSRDKT